MKQTDTIRVALFTDVLKENLDGVTYTLYNLIERVPKKKFEFLFITPYPPSEGVKLPFPVIVCRYIKMPLYGEYPLAFPYFDRNLQKALEEFRPDLVHFTTPSFLGRYARSYAVSQGIPLVTTYHTHFPNYVDYYFKFLPFLRFLKVLVPVILRFYYNRCDRVFVPTRPVLEDLAAMGIERNRMTIWARGIDTDRYSPRHRDDRHIDAMAGRGTLRVLFVSRLFWIKEISTIIKIYRVLEKTRPNVTMVITGDGPQRRYMEKRMPKAVFTGKLINKDLSKMYASCDIFLFPSITETFGNVVLEAMASGLPVVAAAKGGPAGIVRDGETGFLVTPKKIPEFVDRLTYLIDDTAARKKMSKNAVAYAKSQKWETLCKEMYANYELLVKENRKARSRR